MCGEHALTRGDFRDNLPGLRMTGESETCTMCTGDEAFMDLEAEDFVITLECIRSQISCFARFSKSFCCCTFLRSASINLLALLS